MELWLDTIDRALIEEANESGLIFGITTNPSIVSQAKEPLEDLLDDLLNRQPGPIAVQVIDQTPSEMIEQAKDLFDFSSRLIIKIPATPAGLKAISTLMHIGIPTMATAVFEPLQGFFAAKAGAAYVAPYLSHIGEHSLEVIRTLHTLLHAYALPTKLLVASLQTTDQMLQCMQLGVAALTVKEPLFKTCCTAPAATYQFLAKFEEEWQKAPPSQLLPKSIFTQ